MLHRLLAFITLKTKAHRLVTAETLAADLGWKRGTGTASNFLRGQSKGVGVYLAITGDEVTGLIVKPTVKHTCTVCGCESVQKLF